MNAALFCFGAGLCVGVLLAAFCLPVGECERHCCFIYRRRKPTR